MLIEVISGAYRKNVTLKSLVAKAHKAGTKGIRSFQEANQPAAAKPAEAKPAETKVVEVPAAQQVPGGTMDAIFTRIDSRLIHGQVAGTWVPHIAPQTFIAASDNAAHDQLRKSLLLQVAPTSVKTNVLDIAKAYRVYNNPKYTGMKTMFVVESPVDVVRLLNEGVKINEVNVGGVTFKTGMVQLSDAVYASEEHLEAYRELIKRGVKLTVQQLPNHSPVDLEKILKQSAWTHERPDVYSRCSRGVHCGRRIRGGRASVPPPLVACTLMGFALGDPTTGIMLGGALELIALGWMNVGAAMAPDSTWHPPSPLLL